ncbi:MAG: rhomboid family intramembrane serine protease [Planctomycetes bacterium]|nr:rhomboid family intramembrane serine protease [Planctomycetota bacterium]
MDEKRPGSVPGRIRLTAGLERVWSIMRSIGTLKDKIHAQRLSAYLYIQGLPNDLETQDEATWTIWVHSDDQLEQAGALFDTFLADPEDPKYDEAIKKALKQKAQEQNRQKRARTRYIDARTRLPSFARRRFGKVTLVLMALCVVVAIASKLGNSPDVLRYLIITNFLPPHDFTEIRNGQIWRLITPIFIHYGLIHLLFNMLWLKDLGSAIEYRQGRWPFLIMVLAIGVISNLGQYFASGPVFGGMSGVVYGLLGYIGIRSKIDPSSGYYLDRITALIMGVWLFICLFGFVGHVANTAHFVGLGVGLAWGFVSSGKIGRLKRRQ